MTNALRTVSNSKVLSLNRGATPQTCHKVTEVSANISLKPVESWIPTHKKFNTLGNKYEEYLSSIICRFLDFPKISSPDYYHDIQRLIVDAKKSILGNYEPFNKTKRHSDQTKKL